MRTIPPIRTAAAILLGSVIVVSGARAQTNKSSPRVELTDPTPRPDDLQLKYTNPQASHDNSKQAIALRKAQNREQIQKATDLLLLLAQRLNQSLATGDAARHDTAVSSDLSLARTGAQRAYEIETLAKIVEERMKLQ